MPKALTQAEIEKRLAQKHQLPRAQVKSIVGDFTREVQQGVKKQGKVRTTLGLFLSRHKPATKGGEERMIAGVTRITKPRPATTVMKYRPNKETKQIIGGAMRGKPKPPRSRRK